MEELTRLQNVGYLEFEASRSLGVSNGSLPTSAALTPVPTMVSPIARGIADSNGANTKKANDAATLTSSAATANPVTVSRANCDEFTPTSSTFIPPLSRAPSALKAAAR